MPVQVLLGCQFVIFSVLYFLLIRLENHEDKNSTFFNRRFIQNDTLWENLWIQFPCVLQDFISFFNQRAINIPLFFGFSAMWFYKMVFQLYIPLIPKHSTAFFILCIFQAGKKVQNTRKFVSFEIFLHNFFHIQKLKTFRGRGKREEGRGLRPECEGSCPNNGISKYPTMHLVEVLYKSEWKDSIKISKKEWVKEKSWKGMLKIGTNKRLNSALFYIQQVAKITFRV